MFNKVRMVEYREGNKITPFTAKFYSILYSLLAFQSDRSNSIRKNEQWNGTSAVYIELQKFYQRLKKGKIREDRKQRKEKKNKDGWKRKEKRKGKGVQFADSSCTDTRNVPRFSRFSRVKRNYIIVKRLGVGDLNPVSRGSGCDAPVAPATYLLYFLHGLRRSFIFSFTPERKDPDARCCEDFETIFRRIKVWMVWI